ncbi:MAG: hypothetical protein AAGM22_02490, partial [Acidobacteriota bacterium]
VVSRCGDGACVFSVNLGVAPGALLRRRAAKPVRQTLLEVVPPPEFRRLDIVWQGARHDS